MLQLGGLIALPQAVFISEDVDRIFTTIGFSAVTDGLM